MRGWTTTIVVVVCAIVVVVLFHFLFRNQMQKKVTELRATNAERHNQLAEIEKMEATIGPMAREIPAWKGKIELYRAAIPTQIEDNVFFNSLRTELKAEGVSLMGVQVSPGGPWLGNIKEEDSKKLADIGIDVEAARNLKVAFYSIQLSGPYDRCLTVLENLKRHRRMYSIDEVQSPASGGGGNVTQIVDAKLTPIEVSGKIFYGIPANYVTTEKLDGVFRRVVLRPLAGNAHKSITRVSTGLAKEGH